MRAFILGARLRESQSNRTQPTEIADRGSNRPEMRAKSRECMTNGVLSIADRFALAADPAAFFYIGVS